MVAGTGSTYSGQSGWQLQSSNLATTAYQLRIVQLLQETGNSIGNYADWLVYINNHPWTQTTGI